MYPDADIQHTVNQLDQALWRMDLEVAQPLLSALDLRLTHSRWHPDIQDLPDGPLPALWRWWNQLRGEAELPEQVAIAALPVELAAHAALVERVDAQGWDYRYTYYGDAIQAAAGTDHTGRQLSELLQVTNVGLLFLATFRVVARRRLPLYTVHFDCPRLQTVFWNRLVLPMVNPDGQLTRFLVGIQPLTDNPQVVDREASFFQEENRYLRSLLTNSPMGVGIFAGELAFIFANQALAAILRTTVADLQARQLADIYAHEEDFIEQVMTIRKGKSIRNRETPWRADDGAEVWVALSYERLQFTGLNAILVWAYDITERKRLEGNLLAMARTDGLTGVHNRRYFLERAEQERQRSQRYGSPCAVLMLDVDHFKQINDRHGHAIGDQTLRWLAGRLQAALRSNDLLGRMGGEEFALLLPGTPPEQAREAAERLARALRGDAAPDSLPAFTVSIGVTFFQPTDGAMEEALLRADRALYQAKREGRDRVVVYADDGVSSTTRNP